MAKVISIEDVLSSVPGVAAGFLKPPKNLGNLAMPGLDRKQAEEEMTAALEEYALDPWCGIMKNSKKMAETPVASRMIETENLFIANSICQLVQHFSHQQ